MGKSQRIKGSSAEREIAALLSEALGVPLRRTLGQARDGSERADLELPPYSIEVKRRARIAGLYDWIAQASEAAGIPVVACRADGKDWLIVMRLPDWIALAREEVALKMPGNGNKTLSEASTDAEG